MCVRAEHCEEDNSMAEVEGIQREVLVLEPKQEEQGICRGTAQHVVSESKWV